MMIFVSFCRNLISKKLFICKTEKLYTQREISGHKNNSFCWLVLIEKLCCVHYQRCVEFLMKWKIDWFFIFIFRNIWTFNFVVSSTTYENKKPGILNNIKMNMKNRKLLINYTSHNACWQTTALNLFFCWFPIQWI